MKKKMILAAAALCMALLLPSCGQKEEKKEETALVEAIPADAVPEAKKEEAPAEAAPAEEEAAPEAAAPAKEEAPAEQSAETPQQDGAEAPVEYETADGFMSSFLLASERDKIDTTNEYGVFYRVIYEASLEGDELVACGSMDYRNSMEQDSISISSDLKHIFKVDGSTVYQKGGEQGDVEVSKEEFAELLDLRKDSGMFLGVETKNGVVTKAMLFAQ